MEFKMQEIIDNLEIGMKKHSSIDAAFRKELLSFVSKNIESIRIVGNKLKLDIAFFNLFTQKLDTNNHVKSYDENKYYKNFARLKKFNLIHQRSASSFAKSLTLKSINPNHTSLLVDDFEKIDIFASSKEFVLDHIKKNDYSSLSYLYVYLRLFALQPLPQSLLGALEGQNIISLAQNLCIHYVELQESLLKKNEAYKLYIYDTEISYYVHSLSSSKGLIFKNIKDHEKFFLEFKHENFGKTHLKKLAYTARNYSIFTTSPLYTTIYGGMAQCVKLTISELDKLFPNKIDSRLLGKEHEYIKTVFAKQRAIEEDEEDTLGIDSNQEDSISGFSIHEIDSLMLFMRETANVTNIKLLTAIKREISLYEKFDSSLHANMFLSYISYLLKLHELKKLRASTVRGYIWTLNKHLLKNIVRLDDIQPQELDSLHYKLNSGRYKLASVRSITKILNRFFKYHEKEGIAFNSLALSYPKSLVFYDEFKSILQFLHEDAKTKSARLGKHDKLMMLQKQVMVILAYFTGMRKNELRTRLLADLYIFDDKLFIDVNNKGLRKQKLKLKRPSSKRRIRFEVDQESMLIIKEWYQLRMKLQKKSNYLFLKRSTTGTFLNDVIEEEEFDEFNQIIKNVTQRYCTFHSLRHSYCTNQFKQFINGSKQPYELLEHSMQMGHETPEVTISSYFHADIIRVMQRIKNKETCI